MNKPIMRLIGPILFLSFLLISFNNCSGTGSNDGNQSKTKSSGNGVPYGGMLKTGKYIASGNQICGNEFEEEIQVQNVNDDLSVSHIIPCEDKSLDLDTSDFAVSDDGERLLYKSYGYAFEKSTRALEKDNYKVACRTTEANFGAEILVYGPGPVYAFENIALSTKLMIYTTDVSFFYESIGFGQHSFEGDFDTLYLNDRELNTGFIGKWESDKVDSSQFHHMICNNLDPETPVNEW